MHEKMIKKKLVRDEQPLKRDFGGEVDCGRVWERVGKFSRKFH